MKTFDQLVQDALGIQVYQILQQQAELDALRAELATVKAQIPELQPAPPPATMREDS